MMLCITGLVAACAGDPSATRDPGTEQQAMQCAPDETRSCIEKMGKIQRCICSSRDDLRRILEPDRQP